MKKIILSLGLVLGLANVNAQQASLECATLNNIGTATVLALPNAYTHTINTNPNQNNSFTNTLLIQIKNKSTSSYTYSLKRYDEVLGNSAVPYFCVAGNCYPTTTTLTPANQGIPVSASSTYTDQLTVDITETASTVYSRIRYKFTNQSNPNDTLSFRIVYNQVLAINELGSTLVSISDVMPNPSVGKAFVNVQSAKNADCLIKCTNTLGSLMYTKTVQLNEGKNKLDVTSDLPLSDGIYFISIQQGNQVVTKRMIVTH
jgi:hypothetical protein